MFNFACALAVLACGKGLNKLTATILPDFYEIGLFAGSYTQSGTTDATGATARFSRPTQLVPLGDSLYVTDRQNHTVRKIVRSTGVVTTVAGSAGNYGTTDGTGTAARFRNPDGIATDGTYLYIADSSNHSIRRLDPSTGAVITIAGTAGSSGSTNGTGTSASLHTPTGLAADTVNLFIADFGNHAIRKYVLASGEVTTLAGSVGASGSTNGTGTAAKFSSPYALLLDGTSLFVAEIANHAIRLISTDTGVVETFAGEAGTAAAFQDGTGTGARFNAPSGLVLVNGSIYVSDNGNHSIRRIVRATKEVITIVGNPSDRTDRDGALEDAAIYAPIGLIYTAEGLFVSNLTSIRKLY